MTEAGTDGSWPQRFVPSSWRDVHGRLRCGYSQCGMDLARTTREDGRRSQSSTLRSCYSLEMFVPESRKKKNGPLGISNLRAGPTRVVVPVSQQAADIIDAHRARARMQSGYEPSREDVCARLIETYASTLA